MKNTVIQGDCLEEMKSLPENSVDAIVTDPPYGLGFMGKDWDKGVPGVEFWVEMLRVLKPGGHLLSFSGTRTYHRMASAIEDAGFEVRDMIEWVYGSGFPKSLNIGKAVDKMQGNEREVVGTSNGAGKLMEERPWNQNPEYDKNIPVTKGTSEWEGWGTALKPAHEPICMARKPLAEKTVAENVLKYGTGGINIDESRVEGEMGADRALGKPRIDTDKYGKANPTLNPQSPLGRFPANLIHDNSEEVRECFPENKSTQVKGVTRQPRQSGVWDSENNGLQNGSTEIEGYNDSGNASRFFKSIKKDLQYSPKHAILKLCENNISVNNAENNLKTTSQIELVANIFSALKSATPNLDLLNQNLNALFVEKSADSIEIDFVANCVAIKEIPEELVSQQEYIVFQDFMEDYKKCSQTQNPVSVEKWGNTDITQIMTNLLKLCGYVLYVIDENTHLVSQDTEDQKCDYRSLIYQAKASKSERNKGCEELGEKEGIRTNAPRENEGVKTPTRTNNHPTVKPIALMEYLIKMVTPNGGIVLDPFMGSGSTGVACKNLNCSFIGIELDPSYIEIAKKRIE